MITACTLERTDIFCNTLAYSTLHDNSLFRNTWLHRYTHDPQFSPFLLILAVRLFLYTLHFCGPTHVNATIPIHYGLWARLVSLTMKSRRTVINFLFVTFVYRPISFL